MTILPLLESLAMTTHYRADACLFTSKLSGDLQAAFASGQSEVLRAQLGGANSYWADDEDVVQI